MADSDKLPDELLRLFAQPLDRLNRETDSLGKQMKELGQSVQLVIRWARQINQLPAVRSQTGFVSATGRPHPEVAGGVRSSEINALIRALQANTQATTTEHTSRRGEVVGVAAGIIAAEAISPIGTPISGAGGSGGRGGRSRSRPISNDERNRRRRERNLAGFEAEIAGLPEEEQEARRAEYNKRSEASLKGKKKVKEDAANLAMLGIPNVLPVPQFVGPPAALATPVMGTRRKQVESESLMPLSQPPVFPFDFGLEITRQERAGLSQDPANIRKRQRRAGDKQFGQMGIGAVDLMGMLAGIPTGPPSLPGDQTGPFPMTGGFSGPPGGWNWKNGGGSGGGSGSGGGDFVDPGWSLEATQIQVLAAISGLQPMLSSQVSILTNIQTVSQAIATHIGATVTQLNQLNQVNTNQLNQLNQINTNINTVNKNTRPTVREPMHRQGAEFRQAGSALAGAAAIGGIGAIGLAGLIDPNAVSTLTGSFKLLGQEIGKMFVPSIYEASYAIQDLTAWFGTWSDESKVFWGRTILMGVAFLGLGAVIAKTVAGIYTLSIAVKSLMWGTGGGVMLSPLIVGATVLVGVITSLTYAWRNSGKAAKEAGNEMKDAVAPRGQAVGLGALKGALPDEVIARIGGAKHDERIKMLVEEREAIEKRNAVLAKDLAPELADRKEMMAEIEARMKKMSEAGFWEKLAPGFQTRMLNLATELDAARRPGPKAEMIEANKQNIGVINKLIEQMGGPGHFRDAKPPISARYTDALAYRESVQLAALNIPESETRALLNQMEQFNKNMGQDGPMIRALMDQSKQLAEAIKKIQPLQGP